MIEQCRPRLHCVLETTRDLDVEGKRVRYRYRLWMSADTGRYAIEIRREANGGAPPADAAVFSGWLQDAEEARRLFERVALSQDPLLPVHLEDVVRDALLKEEELSASSSASIFHGEFTVKT
ncbi:MAG: hypothetical protein IMW98_09495 [Firmicutes bacterium]|nr:hypothetical protein [Bacillota bacterium]